MVDWAKTSFCVDTTRIMSTGFSYGAIMSHTVACQMSDVFRAVGLMAGSLIGRATACVNHPIAAWMTHGTLDSASIGGVDFAQGEAARDRIVTLNHCAATTQPTTPSPCVAYDGCDSGDPVVWCPVQDEMHAIPPFAAGAIATFFLQF
jgi:poly(3-hydroxybutyrate) depolymerase